MTAPARSIWTIWTGVRANWIWMSVFPAPQTEDTLDCALLEGELASQLLAALREQDLPELAAEIAPDWDLPTEAVQSGLNTLRSHLELVQGDAALLYEMT